MIKNTTNQAAAPKHSYSSPAMVDPQKPHALWTRAFLGKIPACGGSAASNVNSANRTKIHVARITSAVTSRTRSREQGSASVLRNESERIEMPAPAATVAGCGVDTRDSVGDGMAEPIRRRTGRMTHRRNSTMGCPLFGQ